MKKLLILLTILVFISSCGINNEKQKDNKNNKQIEQQDTKFGDLTKYIKDTITDNETTKLQKILKDRKARQAEIKKIIEEATKENKNKIYEEIVTKRETCINRILPFVGDTKKEAFINYCKNINKRIKKALEAKK